MKCPLCRQPLDDQHQAAVHLRDQHPNIYDAAKRAQQLRPIAHGTRAGYHAHLRRDIEPCQRCRAAHARYMARYRASAE